MPDDLDAWVEIPADLLEYSFKIGKYPVTNHQYRRFVDDGGYKPKNGWLRAGGASWMLYNACEETRAC